MRRVDCRRCNAVVVEEVRGVMASAVDPSLYAVSPPLGAPAFLEGNCRGLRNSWDKVFDAVEHVVTCGLEHRTWDSSMLSESMKSNTLKATSNLMLVYQDRRGRHTSALGWKKNGRALWNFSSP